MQLNFDRLYQSIPQSPTSPIVFSRDLTISRIIDVLIIYIFPIVGLLLLIFILVGGFLLLTSGGDPKRAQSARIVLTNAFAGFVVVFSAFWITQMIGIMLGIPDIRNVGTDDAVPQASWTLCIGDYTNCNDFCASIFRQCANSCSSTFCGSPSGVAIGIPPSMVCNTCSLTWPAGNCHGVNSYYCCCRE